MWLLISKGFLFCSLFGSFACLFYRLRRSRLISRKLQEAYETMDQAALRRAKDSKRELALLEGRGGLLRRIEQGLVYSGITRRFPFLTAEAWMLALALTGATAFGLGTWFRLGLCAGVAGIGGLLLLEALLRNKNYRAVDEYLMEFCNLLGNYSITAGEVTGVFFQISRYLPEPLKTVLEECYYEAQTSGDTSLALLSMAEKIEHPKFKELVRNIEVCSRFSADFSILVGGSRRELQDYQRARQERKSMAGEALLYMIMLLILLTVALVLVDQMVDMSVWSILTKLPVGHVCLGVIAVLLGMFGWEIATADKV